MKHKKKKRDIVFEHVVCLPIEHKHLSEMITQYFNEAQNPKIGDYCYVEGGLVFCVDGVFWDFVELKCTVVLNTIK